MWGSPVSDLIKIPLCQTWKFTHFNTSHAYWLVSLFIQARYAENFWQRIRVEENPWTEDGGKNGHCGDAEGTKGSQEGHDNPTALVQRICPQKQYHLIPRIISKTSGRANKPHTLYNTECKYAAEGFCNVPWTAKLKSNAISTWSDTIWVRSHLTAETVLQCG